MNRTTRSKRARVSFRSKARRAKCWATAAMGVCLGLVPGLPLVAQEPAAQAVALERQPYRIGPGDQLELFVWKEPDLTRELIVRVDGMVTVPLIGDVKAGGFAPAELAANIQDRLAKYVNNPSVTVGLSVGQSDHFFLVGKVARPGAYVLEKPTTFLQALALAGGFIEFAKTDRVLVYRESDGQVRSVNYKKLESADDPSENITLEAGDTILVP